MKLYKNHKKSSYSLAVPVINVFGFMYLSLKHLVDRYNLYYAYLPSRKVIFWPKLGQKGLIPGPTLLTRAKNDHLKESQNELLIVLLKSR